MKAILIDDEPKAIEGLKTIINLFDIDLEVIGTATSIAEAVPLIKKSNPDVVFLDVELQDGLGTELLEQFPQRQFQTVFVTGYDQYAIEAFKLRAFNYLLKPVDPDELKKTLNALLAEQKNKREEEDRIMVPTSDGMSILKLEEIVRLKSDNNYTEIHMEQGRPLLVSKTLKKFEDSLSTKDFVRVHQSHMVNFGKIVSYSKKEGGGILLDNGETVPVSKTYKPLIETMLHYRLTSI